MRIDLSNVSCKADNEESSALGSCTKCFVCLAVVVVGVLTFLLMSGIPFSIASIVTAIKSIIAAIK